MIDLAMNSVLCPLDIQLVIKHRQVDHIKIIKRVAFEGVWHTTFYSKTKKCNFFLYKKMTPVRNRSFF